MNFFRTSRDHSLFSCSALPDHHLFDPIGAHDLPLFIPVLQTISLIRYTLDRS